MFSIDKVSVHETAIIPHKTLNLITAITKMIERERREEVVFDSVRKII